MNERAQHAFAILRARLPSAERPRHPPSDFAMGFDASVALRVLARLPDQAGTLAFAEAYARAARAHGTMFDTQQESP